MKSLRWVFILLAGSCQAACEAPWRGPPDWDSIFVADRVVTWHIDVAASDWLKLISPLSHTCPALDGSGACTNSVDCPDTCRCQQGVCVVNYVEADLEVDGRLVYPRVGLRFMGNFADAKNGMPGSKVNMRIRFYRFYEDTSFFGVKRLNLRNNQADPTQIRDALALRLYEKAGVPASRFSFVWVSINDGPGGLYTLVQQIDRKFLEDRFGEDWGSLYKFETGGDLTYFGDQPADYLNRPEEYDLARPDPYTFGHRYEQKTNRRSQDASDLIKLMAVLHQGPGPELEEELPGILDVERYLRALAVNAWLADMDSYPGTSDKTYLYQDASGRFRYIPWDMNRSFGNYHGRSCRDIDLSELDLDAPTCGDPRPLVDRVLATPAFLRIYHDQLIYLVEGVLHPEEVRADMQALKSRISSLVPGDALYNKSWLQEDFNASFDKQVRDRTMLREVWVPGLVPFIQARDRQARQALGGS